MKATPGRIVLILAFAYLMAQSAAARTTTLTYTTWLGDTTAEKKVIDKFMSENPDIKVKLTMVSGGPPQYVEKILTSIIGGSSPDVIRINHECIVPLYTAKGLYNLNALIKQAKLDMKTFYEPNVKLFNFGGSQLGIPLSFNNYAIYYNRKNTSEAGVPELSTLAQAGNWTRDAFAAIAKKLTRDTNGDGRNEVWGIGDVPSWVIGMYVQQAGGSWYSKDGKRSAINTKEAIDGFSFVNELKQKSKVWNPNATWDSMSAKKSALQIVSGWAIGMCNEAKIDYDVADIFRYKESKCMEASGDGYGIGAGSRNKDAAWRLVKYLTSAQAVSQMTKAGDISPTLKSVAEGEDFAKAQKAPRNRAAFIRSMEFTTVTEPRYVKNSKTIGSTTESILNLLYNGKRSPEQTASDIENAVNRLIK